MTYTFNDINDLADYFAAQAVAFRTRESECKRREDAALARGEAYQLEQVAHVLRNVNFRDVADA